MAREIKRFKVELYLDNIYQVLEHDTEWLGEFYQPVFKGSLSDCEAYIRLCEHGYM